MGSIISKTTKFSSTMKTKYVKTSIVVISIIVLGNVLSGFINMFQTYLYQTEHAEFEFTTMPSKGRDVGMMERQFLNFKKSHPEYGDLVLSNTPYGNSISLN